MSATSPCLASGVDQVSPMIMAADAPWSRDGGGVDIIEPATLTVGGLSRTTAY